MGAGVSETEFGTGSGQMNFLKAQRFCFIVTEGMWKEGGKWVEI